LRDVFARQSSSFARAAQLASDVHVCESCGKLAICGGVPAFGRAGNQRPALELF
jgi:hypothetical protein